ncbi:MAG: hypothetical protein COB85_03485 [Bacteroidetes bacterium]|nr:MAG: hypothetical protein COB85_03485 [Bacteroidota bacterium]
MPQRFSIVLLSILSFSNINPVYSTVFTSIENGYWADISTWDIGSVPTTQDTIVIEHFVQGTLNLVVDSLGYLLVQSSGQLCGRNLYMTVRCGGVVDNYGSMYIDSMFVYGVVTTYGLVEILATAYVIGPCPGAMFLVTGGGSVYVKNIECDLTGINDDYDRAILFQVYPNPFSGSTMIELDHQLVSGNSRLHIYDLSGKKVKSYHLAPNQAIQILRANEIGTGMFFIQLVTDGSIVANEKVIVTK